MNLERLRELLEYDPETGVFRWMVNRPRAQVGSIAGYVNKRGYRKICIDRKAYRACRLVWFYINGRWPIGEIDHINGVRDNDRIANLREVSRSENAQNLRRARRNNKTGLLGVARRASRFEAQITVEGRTRHLGVFQRAEDAHKAYLRAKREFHPGGTI